MPGINIKRGGGSGGGPPTRGTLLDKWNHWLSNGGTPGELDALISQARAISPGFAHLLEGSTASRMGMHRWDMMGGGSSGPGFTSMFAGVRAPTGGPASVDAALLSQILQTEQKIEKVLEKGLGGPILYGKPPRGVPPAPSPASPWRWTPGMGTSVPGFVPPPPPSPGPWGAAPAGVGVGVGTRGQGRGGAPGGTGGGGAGGGGGGRRGRWWPFAGGAIAGAVGGSPAAFGHLLGGMAEVGGGVAGEVLGGPIGAFIGAEIGKTLGKVSAEAADTAVAVALGSQPWNQFHIRAARLGISEGLGLGLTTQAFHPGGGVAPQAFQALNLNEDAALSMAAQFPLLAQNPAALAESLQAANQLMPGFSRMPLSATMGAAGQAGTLGLLGRNPEDVPQKTFGYLDKLSRIMEAAGKTGIDQFKVLSTIQAILRRNAQAGGLPTNPSALWEAISPSFNTSLPGGRSGAFAGQVLEGSANRFLETNKSPFQTFLTGQLSASLSPKQLEGILGPKALADPAVQRVYQAYLDARAKLGPRNPITLSFFSQLAAASSHSNPALAQMAGQQVAGMLPGNLSPATRQLLGYSYATNAGFLPTSTFMGAGIGVGGQAPSTSYGAEVLGIAKPGSFWPSGPHSAPNSNILKGLAAQGVDVTNTTMVQAIVSAANATGMSPLVIGAVLNRESSGGRDLSAHGNLMQLTSPAMTDLRRAGLTTLTTPPTDVSQNILLGAEYLKMRGSFSAYNGGGTAGYGDAATNSLQTGMTAAGMKGISPEQVGYVPGTESSSGPNIGAISLQWSSMLSAAQGPIIEFGGALEKATAALAHFTTSLGRNTYNPNIGGGSPSTPPSTHQTR